jgi:di/tricarboxylate transporter
MNTMMQVGTSQARLMLGFMFTTMFLSMWISNTATTAMMLPIVDAVAEAINSKVEVSNYINNTVEVKKYKNCRGERLDQHQGGGEELQRQCVGEELHQQTPEVRNYFN